MNTRLLSKTELKIINIRYGIIAETEETNIASKRVLEKVGFMTTNERGKEGLIFVYKKNDNK